MLTGLGLDGLVRIARVRRLAIERLKGVEA